jgi:hypothetical protein
MRQEENNRHEPVYSCIVETEICTVTLELETHIYWYIIPQIPLAYSQRELPPRTEAKLVENTA